MEESSVWKKIRLCLTFSSLTPYPLHHSALELNSSSTLRPSTTGLKKAGCRLCIQAIHSLSPIEHALGPLHVLWQVSFGCWVTWSIWQEYYNVSSFPKLSNGKQNFFFCLSTTEAWTFYKTNALNPLRFTSHQKNWEKCLLFNLANFWMIKLTKTSMLPNCQVPNSFLYNCKFYDSFGKEDTLIILLSAWDRSRDSRAKRNLSKDM